MLTLNQIIAQIQALAAAHLQIASSGVGTIAEWQANPDRTYPLLWVFHERTDVTDSAIVHRVRLIAADRVKVGESGEDNIGHEQEVLSDMLSVLLDFIAYFAQQHGQSYIVERSGSLEPFTERGNDRVAGVSYVLNVRQPIDFSKCQIPQTGAVIPPSVDGLTLYDFCDPAVIARLTAQQVACLEAEYGYPVTLDINGTNVGSEPSGGAFNINVTLDGSQSGAWDGVDTWEVTSDPCDPATITINGDPYGTVASGATEDISVLSDVGNPVGSLVSGNWEVGNAHLRVNGTNVGNLEPEQTHDHYATINGTQAGSWHNPSQTWRMNVLQSGSPVGSLSGTDWIVAPCADGSAVLKNTVPTTLSTTPVPSGGTVNITAPDASAVLKNTANTTLSTTAIPSNVSANITAPDATAVLKDTAGVTLSTTAIPSNVSQNITAPDGTVTVNGSAFDVVKSNGLLNVPVLQSGSPVGSKIGSNWVVPACPAAASLSVSSSSASPNFGASVTLTATPTGFTPSSYTWYANGTQIGTGASLAWTVNIAGAITILCVATNGTSTAQASTSITGVLVINSVAYFDGVNDSMSFNAMPADGDLGELTFRFRFLSEATFTSHFAAGAFNNGYGDLCRFRLSTNQVEISVWNGSSFLVGLANHNIGAWNEIAFTRKTNSTTGANNVTRIWLNGTLVTSSTNTTAPASSFTVFFGQTTHGNNKVRIKCIALFQGTADNAAASALAAQADNVLPSATGLTLVDTAVFTVAPQVPSTTQPVTRMRGITGRGYCQFNTNFAAPFGLVTP